MSKVIDNPQNLELSQCVKTISDFGSSTYKNICTGTTDVVPWGAVDWLTLIILVSLGIAFTVMFVALTYMIVKS